MQNEEQIKKEQWDRLDDHQKNSFQEEIGKTFKENEYPSYDDILIFLGNNKLLQGKLHALEVPPAVEDINQLWERVFSYFNK